MTKKPFYNIEEHGITQGLLYSWLSCRQKARWSLLGYSPKGGSLSLTYGSIIHLVLEKIYTDIQKKKITSIPEIKYVHKQIQLIENDWIKENPRMSAQEREYLELSLLIAEATMPIYFEFWKKDIKQLKWLDLENEFAIPYSLDDGRKTILRGKMDGVFENNGLWLFETKTKGWIDENTLVDMLPFELQCNLYVWVLNVMKKKYPKGVLYNIIRKIGLQQKKGETIGQFSKRCIEDIRSRPEFYFIRLEVLFSKQDIERFDMRLKEMIKDFYDWWQGKSGHYPNPGSCSDKYGRCKFLTACSSGNMSTYEKRKKVFNELEEV